MFNRKRQTQNCTKSTTLEVTLDRSQGGLGISITGGIDNQIRRDDSNIYITKIMKNGSAAAEGSLAVGDILLKIDGESLINSKHKKAVKLLQKKSSKKIKIVVRRDVDSLQMLTQSGIVPLEESEPEKDKGCSRTVLVSLDISKKGLGVTIAGGIGNEHIPGDTSIFITSVFSNGSAYGILEAGSRIVEIDEKNVEAEIHENVVELLNNVGIRIALRIQRPPDSVKSNQYEDLNIQEEIRIVQIFKPLNGLGFNIVGGEVNHQGIFISFLHPNGAAEATGNIVEGDQILSVNDLSFMDMSHQDAVRILRSCDEVVILELCYQPEKFQELQSDIWKIREENKRKVLQCDSIKL